MILLRNSLFILFALSTYTGFSCDFCNLMDFGNTNNKSFFKIDYSRNMHNKYNTPFTSFNNSATNSSQGTTAHRGLPGSNEIIIQHEDDFELYSEIGLSFNYTHKNRWNLMVGTSYVHNTDNYGFVITPGEDAKAQKETFSGMGDLWLGAERLFQIEKSARFKHIFKVGAILNLPTGKFDVTNVFTDNLHMQPGRAVYGADFNVDYNFEEVGFWGINTSLEYYRPIDRSALPSTFSYRYAQDFTSDLSAYKIFNGTLDKILIAGIRNEYSTMEFVNDFEILNTGGYTGSAVLGLGLSFKNILLQGNVSIPFLTHLNDTQLRNTSGVNISLFYYLGKEKE